MPGTRPQPGAGQLRRAVILTALPVEYEAVRAHLTELREQTHKGTVYEIGKFSALSARWEILITEVGPGNPAAAVEAERAIDYFTPQIALFVGVAGGLKDVKLGDVVAATKVYGYESGKAGATFQPRPDIGQSTHRMIQRAKAEAKKTWQKRIIGTEAPQFPDAFVAPMAAGQKVVADIRAATYEFLRANFTDALAVEMEGIGFLTATHASHPVEALIIRGISDLIKGKSVSDKRGWQEVASRQAAAFAFEVLAKLDLEDRGQVEPEPPARIWNVPHQRNLNFTGRDQLLKDLRQSLTSGEATALTQAALHGLGGVGKTQLALEYAYRHAPDYDLVWWVRSEDPVTLASDYAGLAGPLDLPEKGAADQETQVTAVRQALGQRGKWLLIFDNAGEPQDLTGFRPQGGGGQVLITSRNPAWGGVARPLDVKVWDRPESVAFLLKRTGRKVTTDEKEKAAAWQLAEELGDLPLALEQAGAYIEACGCSIADYLAMFRSQRQEVLKRGKPSQDYPDTVATTWELSFQKVKEASLAAADLLNLCAFLAPDDIPRELLVEGAEHLPESLDAAVHDPVAFNDALAVLRRYSLMEVADDALAVHRLVQAVVRDRLNKKGKEQWAGAAGEMVNEAFPFDIQVNFGAWPWCARLLSHANEVVKHIEGIKIAFGLVGRILNNSSLYLMTRAEFNGAKRFLKQAIILAEAAYGSEHPNVASTANNLGSALQELGDLAGAREQFERALSIVGKEYGQDHPIVGSVLNNLGGVLQKLGEVARAREHYENALAIWEKADGPINPQVAIAMNNIGSVLRALGDLPGARAHLERALAIDEEAYGPNNPQVAIRLNNLGGVLRDLGDLAGARAHCERALAICRQFLREDHPDTILVRMNLATLGLPMDE
jgi:nucleoside phosphorylase/tetratricopeptide (TPR) repeat protein